VQRVLAVLGAVAMVVAAVVIRQAIDDDEGGGDDDAGAPLVVVCADDLADACGSFGADVEVRAEPAEATAAAIADGTLGADVDAWVTSTAWLEVVDARTPDAIGARRAVATSPTVMATAPGRFDAISDLCAADDIWSCLGDAAGQDWADLGDGTHAEWRELKVGLTDPATALGPSGLAAAASGFFGTTEFAANDPAFAEFEGWLANLAGPSAAGDPDPAETLATRPGTYSAAGSVAAIAAAYEGRGVATLDPDPTVDATVAIVGLGDGALPDAGPLRDALLDEGWATANEDDLAPTLKPGVMAALLTLWEAVTR
jgi:hypothetical protein